MVIGCFSSFRHEHFRRHISFPWGFYLHPQLRSHLAYITFSFSPSIACIVFLMNLSLCSCVTLVAATHNNLSCTSHGFSPLLFVVLVLQHRLQLSSTSDSQREQFTQTTNLSYTMMPDGLTVSSTKYRQTHITAINHQITPC